MTYANRRQIPALLAQEAAFTGNTMRGNPVDPDSRDGDGDMLIHCGQMYVVDPAVKDDIGNRRFRYVAWSYQTPIAMIDAHTNEVLLVEHKFSVTTTNHQGLVRRAFGDRIVPAGKWVLR